MFASLCCVEEVHALSISVSLCLFLWLHVCLCRSTLADCCHCSSPGWLVFGCSLAAAGPWVSKTGKLHLGRDDTHTHAERLHWQGVKWHLRKWSLRWKKTKTPVASKLDVNACEHNAPGKLAASGNYTVLSIKGWEYEKSIYHEASQALNKNRNGAFVLLWLTLTCTAQNSTNLVLKFTLTLVIPWRFTFLSAKQRTFWAAAVVILGVFMKISTNAFAL